MAAWGQRRSMAAHGHPKRPGGAWAVALLLALGGLYLGIDHSQPRPGEPSAHAVQMAGSADELGRVLARGGEAPCRPRAGQPPRCRSAAVAARDALDRDFWFIAGYGLAGMAACLAGVSWARTFGTRRMVVAAIWAGGLVVALDVLENALLYRALAPHIRGRGATGVWASSAALVATAKWALAVVFVGGALTGLVIFARSVFRRTPLAASAIRNKLDRSARWQAPAPSAWDMNGRGICFSGGGIRSASFCLGALQRMQEGLPNRGSAFGPVRYLAAVSGGGYIAGAAQLLASRTRDVPRAPAYTEGSAEEDHLRRHANYLADSSGEWLVAVGQSVLKLIANLVLVALAVVGAAQVLGWLGRIFLPGGGRPSQEDAVWPAIPAGVWLALIIMILVGVVGMAAGRARTVPGSGLPDGRSHAADLGRALSAGACALAVVAVVLPLLDGLGAYIVDRLDLPAGARTGAWPTVIIVALLGRIKIKALLREAAGEASPDAEKEQAAAKGRLRMPKVPVELVAGPLLFIVTLGYLTYFATRARWAGPFGPALTLGSWSAPAWAVLSLSAVAVLVAGLVIDAVTWSMHPFYKRRLWSAFAFDPTTGEQRDWNQRTGLSSDGARLPGRPELVLCAAAQVSGPGLAPPGRRAVTWTFDSQWVGGPEIGWCPTSAIEDRLAREGWLGDMSMFGAVAISGAAFGSAMGRHSQGTLSAVYALSNARLGVWLPNPAQVAQGSWRGGRRHLGYLVREVFGRYNPDAPWILVSDGGHYENLGLVELFRRRCTRIVCFDASGDASGALSTVAQALQLAEEELGVTVTLDTPWDAAPGTGDTGLPAGDRLASALSGRLAQEPVVIGTIRYPAEAGLPEGFDHGWLIVGRSVLDPATPWDVLSYAAGNKAFPNDPTSDQWFDQDQFANYRLLGRHVAARVLASLAPDASGWWPNVGPPGGPEVDVTEEPTGVPSGSGSSEEALSGAGPP